jgi:hypothetical protein
MITATDAAPLLEVAMLAPSYPYGRVRIAERWLTPSEAMRFAASLQEAIERAMLDITQPDTVKKREHVRVRTINTRMKMPRTTEEAEARHVIARNAANERWRQGWGYGNDSTDDVKIQKWADAKTQLNHRITNPDITKGMRQWSRER